MTVVPAHVPDNGDAYSKHQCSTQPISEHQSALDRQITAAPVLNVESQARASALRVLVVDDEPSVANSLGAVLLFEGHQVLTAYSAEEALSFAGELRPDVLIADVVMTGMNGIELATKIYSISPACRVLLISGELMTGSILEKYPQVGTKFVILPKPANPREVLAFVTRSLESHESVLGDSTTMHSPPKNEQAHFNRSPHTRHRRIVSRS